MHIAQKTIIALVAIAFSVGMVVSVYASGAEATMEKVTDQAAESTGAVKEATSEVVENAKNKAIDVAKEKANEAVDTAAEKATGAAADVSREVAK